MKKNLLKLGLTMIIVSLLVALLSTSQKQLNASEKPFKKSVECPTQYPGIIYLPDPNNLSNFYVCENGVPILMHCPEGLEFDEYLSACDWPGGSCD